MLLPHGLWILGLPLAMAEICGSPGDHPAPQIFLDKPASHPGDPVVVKCKVPALSPLSRVIFCRNGKDLAVQPVQEGKFAYELHYEVRANRSARFACLYQHKDNRNLETNSLLSAPQFLRVTDSRNDSKHDPGDAALPEGFAIPLWVWILRTAVVLLLLASAPIVTCMLEKAAAPWPEPARPGGRHGK